MGEFFKGWRRTTGCVTLVMACVAMSGWIRSSIHTDCLERIHCHSRYAVASRFGFVSLLYQKWPDDSATPWGATRFRIWSVADSPQPDKDGVLQPYDPAYGAKVLNWRWRWVGFYGSSGSSDTTGKAGSQLLQFEYRMVHYWSITIPLTLLSAYLLLVKPRVGKAPVAQQDRATIV